MNNSQHIWTEEEIVDLLDMWQASMGGTSIAKELRRKYRKNYTRNSVIGMVNRLRKKFGWENVDVNDKGEIRK